MNKNMTLKSLFLTLMLTGNVEANGASETYVFCGALDGAYWYWARTSDGAGKTVQGEWHSEVLSSGQSMTFFKVDEKQYKEASLLCRPGDVAQPADHSYSPWRTFQVIRPNGETFFAPGFYQLHSLEASFQLRV
ncbi:hypothetical protein [Hahella ganghwensis]|uniref:hypothetical protein n=1 Tax=Hahella ganghwensis TaxID=286420 RepID=UPI00037A9300|nr:hypothetical protein [Hahella ganghwensis]